MRPLTLLIFSILVGIFVCSSAAAKSKSIDNQFMPRWATKTSHHHQRKSLSSHNQRRHQLFYATVYPGSLQNNIRRIAAKFGWYRVIWQLSEDYHWIGKTMISGNNFETIFKRLLQPFPLQARFYQGNNVLIIIPRTLTRRHLPAVVIASGYYVDTHPINLKKEPRWLRRSVSLAAYKMPLSILMNRLLHNANISVIYDNTVKPNRLLSLDYSGSVKGALGNIAAETNYCYTLNKHSLRWSAFETKIFNVSFISGRHHLVAWHDLSNILNQMKSPQGHVILSQSTKTITVRDHPNNVNNMAAYMKRLPIILRNRS